MVYLAVVLFSGYPSCYNDGTKVTMEVRRAFKLEKRARVWSMELEEREEEAFVMFREEYGEDAPFELTWEGSCNTSIMLED